MAAGASTAAPSAAAQEAADAVPDHCPGRRSESPAALLRDRRVLQRMHGDLPARQLPDVVAPCPGRRSASPAALLRDRRVLQRMHGDLPARQLPDVVAPCPGRRSASSAALLRDRRVLLRVHGEAPARQLPDVAALHHLHVLHGRALSVELGLRQALLQADLWARLFLVYLKHRPRTRCSPRPLHATKGTAAPSARARPETHRRQPSATKPLPHSSV
mmetsp:Transcript_106277/g.339286  ORF Transcript_106277/g.339286 Transcript_106277/m.339286 type:complete len:217 (+) Transcript_106277:823-1473(+)